MTEAAVTLPLEVLESVIATCKRLHPGNLKPRDREMLAIAEREVEQVRGMVNSPDGGPG